MIWLESLSFRHGAHLKLIAPYVLPDYHSNSAGEMDDGSIFASWRQTIRQQFRVGQNFLKFDFGKKFSCLDSFLTYIFFMFFFDKLSC